MADETPGAPRPGSPRVVKKVVKKTVVRPVDAPGTTKAPARPRAPKATAVSRVGKRPGGTSAAPTRPGPARPRLDVGAKLGTAGRALGSRSSGALRSGVARVRRTGGTLGTTVTERAGAARAWRIPTLDPLRACATTGVVTGLVVTLLGWLAGLLFLQVRGTSAGGGQWGGLVLVAVAAGAFALGAWLLRSFGLPMPWITSFLAVVLVVLAVLGPFLELAAGRWAWLLLPLLAAAAFTVAHKLLMIAEENAGTPA